MMLSGFHVSIHSDGEMLEEHPAEVSPDKKKVSCWIPSQSGKEFVVEYRDGKSSTIMGRAKSAHVYTDGKNLVRRVSHPHHKDGRISGMRISVNVMRPFTFADIRTTDENEVAGDTHAKPGQIGAISVRVLLAKSRKISSTVGRYKIQDHPPALVHERAKKAGQHCVSLGDERPSRFSNVYDTVYEYKEPELVFEFRYRPTPVLQALGIIPSPKREAPPVIDVEDEDTPPPLKRQKTAHDEDLMQSMQAGLKWLRHRVNKLEEGGVGSSGVKKEEIAIKHGPGTLSTSPEAPVVYRFSTLKSSRATRINLKVDEQKNVTLGDYP